MANQTPPNRPMLTRILEQSTVGILAAAAVLWANDKVQDSTLENIASDVSSMQISFTQATVRLEAKIEKIDDKVNDLQRDIYNRKK